MFSTVYAQGYPQELWKSLPAREALICHRLKTQVRYDRYMIFLALLHKLIALAILPTGSTCFCE